MYERILFLYIKVAIYQSVYMYVWYTKKSAYFPDIHTYKYTNIHTYIQFKVCLHLLISIPIEEFEGVRGYELSRTAQMIHTQRGHLAKIAAKRLSQLTILNKQIYMPYIHYNNSIL
jgi:hypothetical protein